MVVMHVHIRLAHDIYALMYTMICFHNHGHDPNQPNWERTLAHKCEEFPTKPLYTPKCETKLTTMVLNPSTMQQFLATQNIGKF